jgi:hypothetical protein
MSVAKTWKGAQSLAGETGCARFDHYRLSVEL